MDHKDDINDAVTLIKYAVLAGIPLALILVEPNLSTTICTALVICLLIYVGRTELQIYRNCTSYISSSGYYLFKYRRPAKPAIF